ncbi:MAG: vitamin K epoxide reductase family protein [Dehalococcoidia bacterium]
MPSGASPAGGAVSRGGLRLNVLLLLAVLGTAVAVYLTYVALDSEEEPFCSGIGDCATVQSSEYAKVGPVPVAVLGLGMYLGLLGLILARRFASFGRDPRFALWTFALAMSGALYSAYLTYLEFFVIDAICVWCVISATIVTLIFVCAIPDLPAARAELRARAR